jgi:hypothetical protein
MPDPLVPESARAARLSLSSPEAVPVSPRGPETAPPADGLPRELGLDDLRRTAQTSVSWLWQGYLAPGSVTLLTSQWKSGKTTLVAVLLARLKTGGELAGRPLAAGNAVVVSEESPQQWERRSRKLDFGAHTRAGSAGRFGVSRAWTSGSPCLSSWWSCGGGAGWRWS